MKVKKVLVSQPRPAVIEKSPFYELSEKYNVEIAYKPFIRVVGVSLKEFRAQRVEILTHTAVIFTSRTTVDSFFHICEEARITVPETMKYICQTDYGLLALYSPSDVKTLVDKFGTENLPAVAVFGEGTLRAALAAGITVQANAPTPVAPSMAKANDIYLPKVHKGEEIEPVELVTDTEKEEFIRSQQHKLAKKSRTRRTAEPRK